MDAMEPMPEVGPSPLTSGQPRKSVRRRRPVDEVRSLLLESARAVFGEQGFTRATTREIASRAGVQETILFRQFGTKQALFEQAVFAPLKEFAREFVTQVECVDSVEELGERFFGGLYKLMMENRELLRAAMSAHIFESRIVKDAMSDDPPVAMIMDYMEEQMQMFLSKQGWKGTDVVVAARGVFAMMFGIAMLDDLLYEQGTRPTQTRMIRGLSDLATFGMASRFSREDQA